MRRILIILTAFLVVLYGAARLTSGAVEAWLEEPFEGTAGRTVMIEVPRGATAGEVAGSLAAEGVIRDPRVLQWWLRATGRAGDCHGPGVPEPSSRPATARAVRRTTTRPGLANRPERPRHRRCRPRAAERRHHRTGGQAGRAWGGTDPAHRVLHLEHHQARKEPTLAGFRR